MFSNIFFRLKKLNFENFKKILTTSYKMNLTFMAMALQKLRSNYNQMRSNYSLLRVNYTKTCLRSWTLTQQ